MSNNVGYFKFPRELLLCPNWKSFSLEYRHIFITLMANVAYFPTNQNDHGKMIEVKPGQILITYRELVRLCDEENIDLAKIQRALKRFKDVGFSIQETIHVKTLITVTESNFCKYLKDTNDTRNDTQNDTRTIQERYTKQEVKKQRNKEVDVVVAEKIGGVGEVMNNDQITKDDIYFFSVKSKNDWTPEEIEKSWEAYSKANNVHSPIKYIEGTIKKMRLLNTQKENQSCKKILPLKQQETKNKKSLKDSGFYSENDTLERPLAKFAPRNGPKIES